MADIDYSNSFAVTRADARHHVFSLVLVLVLFLAFARVDCPWLLPFSISSGVFYEGIDTRNNIRVKDLRCMELRPSTESVRQSGIDMYSYWDTNTHDSVSTTHSSVLEWIAHCMLLSLLAKSSPSSLKGSVPATWNTVRGQPSSSTSGSKGTLSNLSVTSRAPRRSLKSFRRCVGITGASAF